TRSCQIAVASRPWLRPNSMASRNGSQALEDAIGWGFSVSERFDSTPNPVITALAGFAFFASAFPLVRRFSGLGVFVRSSGFALDPVVTSLAGFPAGRRAHTPGGRTPIPAAFR